MVADILCRYPEDYGTTEDIVEHDDVEINRVQLTISKEITKQLKDIHKLQKDLKMERIIRQLEENTEIKMNNKYKLYKKLYRAEKWLWTYQNN